MALCLSKNHMSICGYVMKLLSLVRPGATWIYGFFKRNPQLSSRKPENLGHARAGVTETVIRQWFDTLEKFLLKEHKIVAADFFTPGNGDRIGNLDEVGFPLQGTNSKLKVVGQKGSKNKTQITVLACASASGNYSKPFVIYPSLKSPRINFSGVNEADFEVGFTPNGWITCDSFFSWLANCFYPSIRDKVEFPFVMFMDGHSAHINLAVSDFCKDHGIILYCLPAHSSHILQPLDIVVFGPIKAEWNNQLNHFRVNYKVAMTKSHFFQVFDKTWKKGAKPENAISGFRSAGLVPFDRNAVDYSKVIDGNAITEWRKRSESKKCDEAEIVGVARCLNIVEERLSAEDKELFARRFEEGYDVQDNSYFGKLWSVYSDIRKAMNSRTHDDAEKTDEEPDQVIIENDLSIEPVAVPETNIVTQETVPIDSVCPITMSRTTTADSSTSESTTSAPLISASATSALSITNAGIPTQTETSSDNVQEFTPIAESTFIDEGPSTSGTNGTVPRNRSYYDNFGHEPFRHYLKISDELIVSKKNEARSNVPPAITGIDYRDNLQRNQDKKKRELEEKERRKQEREQKKRQRELEKNNKEKKKRKVVPEEVSENDEDKEDEITDEVILDDSSDCELIDEDKNICFACHGSECWDDNSMWIGCGSCSRWFHKACISVEVEDMSREELAEYNFICTYCERAPKKSMGRKTKNQK